MQVMALLSRLSFLLTRADGLGTAGGDVEEAVQVMKLFCYELMDMGSPNGAPVAELFRANMDPVIAILTTRSDEVGSGGIRAMHQACARHGLHHVKAVTGPG